MSLSLALALALPNPVEAAWCVDAAQDPLEEARDLHERATAHYETHDYEQAITLWTQAYRRVGSDPAYASIRAAIVYNLATARVRQFDLDGDRSQLLRARRLLEDYRESGSAPEDHATIAERIHEIEAKLGEDELRETDGDHAPAASEGDAGRPPVPSPPSAASDEGVSVDRSAKVLIASGAAVGTVGLGLLGAAGAGLAMGRAAQQRGDDLDTPAADLSSIERSGRRANRLAIATGISGGLLLATGVGLVIVGAKRRARPGAPTFALSREGVVVGWTGRF